MTAVEQTFEWKQDGRSNTTPAGSVPFLDRRQMLALIGAAAASLALTVPAPPPSSARSSAVNASAIAAVDSEIEQFLGLVGETFTVHAITGDYLDAPAQLALASISIPERDPTFARPLELRNQPFSLFFRLDDGFPGESGIFRFEHNALGTVELFAHQVLSADETTLYEVVFN